MGALGSVGHRVAAIATLMNGVLVGTRNDFHFRHYFLFLSANLLKQWSSQRYIVYYGSAYAIILDLSIIDRLRTLTTPARVSMLGERAGLTHIDMQSPSKRLLANRPTSATMRASFLRCP